MSHVQNLAKLETFRPTALLGTSATKKWENVGILKTQEWGGVYPNPTSFVIWPSDFWHAKFILRC